MWVPWRERNCVYWLCRRCRRRRRGRREREREKKTKKEKNVLSDLSALVLQIGVVESEKVIRRCHLLKGAKHTKRDG
jgi:hypothetical protein